MCDKLVIWRLFRLVWAITERFIADLDLTLIDLPGMTKNPVEGQPEDIEKQVGGQYQATDWLIK